VKGTVLGELRGQLVTIELKDGLIREGAVSDVHTFAIVCDGEVIRIPCAIVLNGDVSDVIAVDRILEIKSAEL